MGHGIQSGLWFIKSDRVILRSLFDLFEISSLERYAIAQNPKTPKDTLKQHSTKTSQTQQITKQHIIKDLLWEAVSFRAAV